jgi:hypothetical protein
MGYGGILVRDGTDAGWINYMLKGRQKSEFDALLDRVIMESLIIQLLTRGVLWIRALPEELSQGRLAAVAL